VEGWTTLRALERAHPEAFVLRTALALTFLEHVARRGRVLDWHLDQAALISDGPTDLGPNEARLPDLLLAGTTLTFWMGLTQARSPTTHRNLVGALGALEVLSTLDPGDLPRTFRHARFRASARTRGLRAPSIAGMSASFVRQVRASVLDALERAAQRRRAEDARRG
jgi:hypothetical protein